jgi:predicted alpha/beta-fold hydrolase
MPNAELSPNSAYIDDFAPNPLLRNAHLQTILSGTRLRGELIKHRHREFIRASRDYLLDCGDGVRLLGHYSPASGASRGLATLIHGWEGSADSNNILSLGGHLHCRGFSVFRLNLRDHGPTHHLNRDLFNSTRLDEVLGAVDDIQRHFSPRRHFLAGFSLGGNFCLRIAAAQARRQFTLDHAVAVCPVVNPPRTMRHVEQSAPAYHNHFVRRWKHSLSKKLAHFPEHELAPMIEEMATLREMHRFFVPRFTDYGDADSYLDAYSLAGNRLQDLQIPSTIIASEDDPVIPVGELLNIARPAALAVEITRRGGHCGYLENLRLDSWIDQRIEHILERYAPSAIAEKSAAGDADGLLSQHQVN